MINACRSQRSIHSIVTVDKCSGVNYNDYRTLVLFCQVFSKPMFVVFTSLMEYESQDYGYENDDLYEEETYYDGMVSDFAYAPTYPDPFIIGIVTIIASVLVFAFLTQLTTKVFGTFIASGTAIDSGNSESVTNKPESLSNESIENNSSSVWDGNCNVSNQFPQKITQWCGLITEYALQYNLDPDLVAAVVWLESGGNSQAYSHSGAVGLMQVMPSDGLAASFMCANGPCFKDRPSTNELFDPEFNIAFGTKFLAGLVRKYGNVREALRSYGPMDAGYTYSDKVISIFNRYKGD